MTLIVEAVGKREVEKYGIHVPRGFLVELPEGARKATEEIGGKVVIKAQVRTTGRAGQGLVGFADSPEDAARFAERMLGRIVKGFPVTQVLIEEFLDISREYFAGIITDTKEGRPLVIFSSRGGSGIEEIARDHPESVAKVHIDYTRGLRPFEARELARKTGLSGKEMVGMGAFLEKLYAAFIGVEARSLEVNPVVLTSDGRFVAADCHLTVDDYAVFRHPELDVEIARELGHPPTALEKSAYACEKDDYRGTFYFIQLESDVKKGEGWLGFHGSGGGGSMMSMDAVSDQGFKVADFCDTSGNPPASKVYRAGRIILAQSGIDGYFLSGSGVASQEQYHGARGLIKAFREEPLRIPAVIRLGGNREELAIEYLNRFCADLPVTVEAYGKDDKVTFCAERMRALIDEHTSPSDAELEAVKPLHNTDTPKLPYEFKTLTGKITFDHAKCAKCESKACIEACKPGILELNDKGAPALNISLDDAARGKCTECLACEAECFYSGETAVRIELPIPGLM
ncbi:acetate--CoA ligase family protein [bacterium]|nr:acetate--CoA ligase family protein [bacterium]